MDYKNLINRSFISLILLILYFYLSLQNYNYLFYFITIIYFFITLEILINFKSYKVIILSYLFASFFFLLKIDFNEITIIVFNMMTLCIITFDIFSYIGGSLFGKNKIFKYVSPRKTFEGLLIGFFLSLFSSCIYIYFFDITFNTKIFIFILFIIIFSFLGDIIESLFKRINNLKNSSSYLPGHGGFFDRFDSFILNIILFSIFYNYL